MVSDCWDPVPRTGKAAWLPGPTMAVCLLGASLFGHHKPGLSIRGLKLGARVEDAAVMADWWMKRGRVALTGTLRILMAVAGVASARAVELPEGPGLAAAYPGDAGIADHGDVIFADGFESGDLKLWDEDQTGGDGERLEVSSDESARFHGNYGVRMSATRGKNTGAGLIKWLDKGEEEIFLRFYVRFAPDAGYVHHFVHVNGSTDRWGSFGKAGLRPNGTDFFTTGIEPWFDWGNNPPPGKWNFYSYWPDMKASRDGKFWGNSFHPEAPAIPRDQWICMEIRVRMNTPGGKDGEQSVWQDGKLIGDFKGIRWRDTEKLKANVIWLMNYVTEKSYVYSERHAPGHGMEFNPNSHTVWFDQIVVARTYIGPMNPGKVDE